MTVTPASTAAQASPASAGLAAERAARLREDLVHADPLLDCLIEVCRLHGQSATRASLSAGLPLVAGRLTLALAERAAARAGMACKLQRRALE
ncbi:MAG: type I secretion system permease/ATPase, partial [Caldimonas sp.]